MPNTVGGLKLPYPAASDPVAQGAAAIQALAQAMETDLRASELIVIPSRGYITTGAYGTNPTNQFCWLPWAATKALGLRWQLRLTGESYSNQSNAYANIRLQADFVNVNGAAVTGYQVWNSAINPSPTTPVFRDSGWITLDPPATWDAYAWTRLFIATQADNTGQNHTSMLQVQARLLAP